MVCPPPGNYRSSPADAEAIIRAVDLEPISRDGLARAFSSALEAIKNTDDPQVDAVIYALSGLDGDLRGAPSRIDARIGVIVESARTVLGIIEDGDRTSAQQTDAAAQGAFDAKRFGRR